MDGVTSDQSYQMGRFVAIARRMELEIFEKDGLMDAPSRVESRLKRFIDVPAITLDDCQIELINAQIQLKDMDSPRLLQDLQAVFNLIDVPGLNQKSLDYNCFMDGYHFQLDTYL